MSNRNSPACTDRAAAPLQKKVAKGKSARHARHRGVTLIELMISMTLGLVAIGALGSLFVASKQISRIQENLGDVQEAGRLGFEVLAREVRMAGHLGCPRTGRVVNLLKNQGSDWWANAFAAPIAGYDEAQTFAPATTRIAGTDVLTILRAGNNSMSVTGFDNTNERFTLNKAHTFKNNGVAIVCDNAQASVFHLATPSGSQFDIQAKSHGTTGNCSAYVGHPGSCPASAASEVAGSCSGGLRPCDYTYGADATVSPYEATAFYIGTNDNGVRALFRMNLSNAFAAQEIIEGVWDMQLLYGQDTNADGQADRYQSATQLGAPGSANWAQVVSVQVNLVTYSPENNVTTDKQQYTAGFTSTSKTTATDNHLRKAFSGTAFVRTPFN